MLDPFLVDGRETMPLSHSIEELLALAAETSAVDDEALDLLGRHVLSALIVDPEIPEFLRRAAARMLRSSENPASSVDRRLPDVPPD
jgi:hypothetical protein